MSAVPKPALPAERQAFYAKIDQANVTPCGRCCTA